jgi:hypothetical protein
VSAREAAAVAPHFTVVPHTWKAAGRVLLGRKPIVAVFWRVWLHGRLTVPYLAAPCAHLPAQAGFSMER